MTNSKSNNVFRHGVVLRQGDHEMLLKVQKALAAERGGEVSVSDTIRDAIRFRARQLKGSSKAA